MYKKIIISISLFFLVIFLSVLYFVSNNKSHDLIILEADSGATKIKPENPGGLVIPNSDSLVYNKLYSKDKKEPKTNLLPAPEKPMRFLKTNSSKAKYLDSIDEILANIELYEDKLLKNDYKEDFSEEFILPNKLTSKEEQEKDLEKDFSSVLKSGFKVIQISDDRYSNTKSEIVSGMEEGYKIQLSISYSMPDAKKQWDSIKKKHIKILKNSNLITKRIEGKNKKFFYLVMSGTYPSLNHAKMICKKLNFRNQSCIIVK